MLNFWASWCPPCVDELPLLEKAQRGIESSGATVLGVNYKDIPEDALAFVRDYGVSYPSLRDPDGEFAELYGARGIPETFVIDRDGRIAAVQPRPDRPGLDRRDAAADPRGGELMVVRALLRCGPAARAGDRARRRAAGLAAGRRGRGDVRRVRHGAQPLDLRRRRPRARVHPPARSPAGKTKEEIKDGLVARFGPSVLALPEDEGFGLAAYVVPALAVLLALIAVALAARRWRRRVPAGAPAPDLSAEDARRIDRELDRLD